MPAVSINPIAQLEQLPLNSSVHLSSTNLAVIQDENPFRTSSYRKGTQKPHSTSCSRFSQPCHCSFCGNGHVSSAGCCQILYVDGVGADLGIWSGVLRNLSFEALASYRAAGMPCAWTARVNPKDIIAEYVVIISPKGI